MSTSSAVDLMAYRQEAINHLASMTIKFTPIAKTLNETVASQGFSVDEGNPATWKYYVNMAGEYHAADTMMTVVSLDTKETISFTKENLAGHPRTAEAYIPGTTYWTDLQSRYPTQLDLIKSIVYPVSDIAAAIKAPDFTILNYSKTFLGNYEIGYITGYLESLLSYISSRWYFTFLSYEVYYTWTFWGSLWYHLLSGIYAARVKAIFTPNVHPFHIWQYLMSYGLDDYSDLLTRKQSLYLYRNMNYLMANRGKQSNLVKLVENLLSDIGVGMYGRDIIQQTLDGAANYQTTPEFIATDVDSNYASIVSSVPAASMAELNSRMVNAGDEITNSAEYIAQQTDTLGNVRTNLIPTKFIEIRPIAKGRQYADLLNNFVIESLLYLIINDIYTLDVEISTSVGTLTLTLKECVALIYYSIHKSQYETPVNIPTLFSPSYPFSLTPKAFPESINRYGVSFPLSALVDIQTIQSMEVPIPSNINDATSFSTLIGNQFLLMAYLIEQHRGNAEIVSRKGLEAVRDCLLVKQQNMPLDLGLGYTTYEDWFANGRRDIANGIVNAYDISQTPQNNYTTLVDALLTAIIPITDILSEYGNFLISDTDYTRLKNLFISLISYNVTLLNTDRDINQYLTVSYVGGHRGVSKQTQTSDIAICPGVTLAAVTSNVIEARLFPKKIESKAEFTQKNSLIIQRGVTIESNLSRKSEISIRSIPKPKQTHTTRTVRAILGAGAYNTALGSSVS